MTKNKVIDFVILSLRWYLAFYMFSYGFSKLTGGQFGLHDPSLTEKPMKELDKFYIAWYLFSLSPIFKILVGASQIIGALLVVIDRTALIGVLILIPIIFQIFLIDIAFTTNIFGVALPVRMASMLVSAILILIYYKEDILKAFQILSKNITTKFHYKWWLFLLLPIIGFLMDFVFAILTWPIRQLLNILIN